MKKHSRFSVARGILIFWTLFIGLGAVAGSVGMLADPTGKSMGMDAMLPYFQVLPFADVLFRDYSFSGFALLIVNGLTNLTAAELLLARKKIGTLLGSIFGVTLMLWICIQFYMFPPNFMSSIYFVFGAAQAITGYCAWVFERQEDFCVNVSDYKNIGKNPERLVVYFSRLGYTKKIAYEEADRTGAEIYEIRSTERTEGTAGFWWCGRFAMRRMEMPIEEISVDLSAYAHVTICSPVWAFSLSAPVRTFCKCALGEIREADVILVHHQNASYRSAAEEAYKLLGIENTGFCSISCQKGRYGKRTAFENKK